MEMLNTASEHTLAQRPEIVPAGVPVSTYTVNFRLSVPKNDKDMQEIMEVLIPLLKEKGFTLKAFNVNDYDY